MKRVGITTTVPVELIIAAGYEPVDLNNIFISHPSPAELVASAEKDGFPLNTCTWIKGIYGACLESGLDTVICVTGGDCSNTLMLGEVLELRGVRTIGFSYPQKAIMPEMQKALQEMATTLGSDLERAEEIKRRLRPTRDMIAELDRLTWQENRVSGFENHFWQVCSSDFNCDPARYEMDVSKFLNRAKKRRPFSPGQIRLGYIGVPPIFAGTLYEFIEASGGRVVFNEIQRQFTMPVPGANLAEQYCRYTYPYSTRQRLEDILAQVELRQIDGFIHYVQSFCHRAISDIVFKSKINLPILTIEGGSDFELNQHLKTRIEAYLDMLEQRKTKNKGGLDLWQQKSV